MKSETSKARARTWSPGLPPPMFNIGLDGYYRMGQITMAPSAVLARLEKSRLVDPLTDEVRRLSEIAALSEAQVRHVEEQADRLIGWDALVAERDRLRAALLEYVQRQEGEGDPSGLPEYEQGRAALEGRGA